VNDVKKNKLMKSLMAALLLTSGMAMAESDYPAADYQPKVLYTNPDYKESAATAPAAKSAPASKPAAVEVEADPNFPAANFQPKVLYSDSGYKHNSAAPVVAGSSSTASSASKSSASAANEVIQTEKAASTDFSMIGLLVLAAAGFLVYSKKSGSKGAGSSSASGSAYAESKEATGVEKYLDRAGINKTGVAKYLEKQAPSTTTGVARYMAKQIVKDREAAAAKATGVEKYLREKV
jgi:hypothetical protein